MSEGSQFPHGFRIRVLPPSEPVVTRKMLAQYSEQAEGLLVSYVEDPANRPYYDKRIDYFHAQPLSPRRYALRMLQRACNGGPEILEEFLDLFFEIRDLILDTWTDGCIGELEWRIERRICEIMGWPFNRRWRSSWGLPDEYYAQTVPVSPTTPVDPHGFNPLALQTNDAPASDITPSTQQAFNIDVATLGYIYMYCTPAFQFATGGNPVLFNLGQTEAQQNLAQQNQQLMQGFLDSTLLSWTISSDPFTQAAQYIAVLRMMYICGTITEAHVPAASFENIFNASLSPEQRDQMLRVIRALAESPSPA